MITAIDTNILLDILIPNTRYAEVSKELLDDSLAQGALVICESVYAELAAQFPSRQTLEAFLTDTNIGLRASSLETLHRASEAWRVYAQVRHSQGMRCPACGAIQSVTCSSCGTLITVRQHILTDFLIGAHALLQADRLLTRDLGYYHTYFKNLLVVTPTATGQA